MLYDKEIQIVEISEGNIDDYGVYKDGIEATVKIINCDVQPYSKEAFYKDYGYDEKVSIRIFCDVEPLLKIGTIILFQDIRHEIRKIIAWDNYMELMCNAI